MKGLIKHSALALMVMAAGYNTAMADPVNINITGRVIASPCTVSSTSQNVNLGDIQATALATLGSVSPLVPFSLELTACPAGTTNVIATFSGTDDTAATGRYTNTGTASNVAIEIWQGSTTTNMKGNGTTITMPVLANRTVSFPLSVRAYAKGLSTPGTIAAVAQVAFTYN